MYLDGHTKSAKDLLIGMAENEELDPETLAQALSWLGEIHFKLLEREDAKAALTVVKRLNAGPLDDRLAPDVVSYFENLRV